MNTADQFDGKIAEYIEKARSLREQRNSQIPLISRIPSELLAGVFEFLAQVDPDEPSPSPYHQPERSSGDYHPCENIKVNVAYFHTVSTQAAVPTTRRACLTTGLRTIQSPGSRTRLRSDDESHA
ncbi:hypothetical protein PTI98_010300 [Pleurotus ostreatus]|nr:hypothetical protein PTI98_010300 [Pleurotus ostreatus]